MTKSGKVHVVHPVVSTGLGNPECREGVGVGVGVGIGLIDHGLMNTVHGPYCEEKDGLTA